METEVTIQHAQMGFHNRQTSEEERNSAISVASADGITTQYYLRVHSYLQAMNINTVQAAEWQKEVDEDFGDYYDNAAVVTVIRYQLAHGDEIAGLTRACHLLKFIMQRGDKGSVFWLVPEIEAMIAQRLR